MSDTDFTGKRVLVVGGSSGIGNGVAHAFRRRGAEVAVWGTRPTAADYRGEEGSDLTGLEYAQVDVSSPSAIDVAQLPFDSLDVLVLSQGVVLYNKEEFTRDGWSKVMAINIDSVMQCSEKFRPMLKGEQRGFDHHQFDLRIPRQYRQPGIRRFQSGGGEPYPEPRAGLCARRHSRKRRCAGLGGHQAHKGHHHA